MKTYTILGICSTLLCLPALAQNGAAAAPQTGSAAPAATGAASQKAQAAEAAATRNSAAQGAAKGSESSPQAGAPSTGAQTSGPQTGAATQTGTRKRQTGITGVPRYHAGFRGPRNQPAAKATARVTVTGDTDGNGAVNTDAQGKLPGIPQLHNALGVPSGTPIMVKLLQPVDSGHAKNGDMLRGVLAAPLGGIQAGAPVQLTVVASAAAGQMTSYGELSLQVVSINGQMVLSDVVTAEGKEGKTILADDAPARGTEAVFPSDQPITLPTA